MLKYASLFALAVSLVGCGTMPFDYDEGVEAGKTSGASGSLARSIPPSQAMAAVPFAAGQVVSVIERQRGNALQHDITLSGAPPNFGSNQVTVTAYKYVDTIPEKPGEDMLPMAKPTDEDIYNEMQERIPGGALPVSNNIARNGMGAFGYAYGRRGAANCLYAWQWIESGVRPFNPIANKSQAPISVRVRICRPGMTEEVMVDFVRQMYVQPRPYGGAPSYGPMVTAPSARPYGTPDALAAARGTGAGYPAAYGPAAGAYAANPYGSGYAPPPAYGAAGYAYAQPQPQPAAAPARPVVKRVAAAPRKTIRRIVRRRVVAPQIYSYTPPVDVPKAAPVIAQPASPGGYSTVPMPQ